MMRPISVCFCTASGVELGRMRLNGVVIGAGDGQPSGLWSSAQEIELLTRAIVESLASEALSTSLTAFELQHLVSLAVLDDGGIDELCVPVPILTPTSPDAGEDGVPLSTPWDGLFNVHAPLLERLWKRIEG